MNTFIVTVMLLVIIIVILDKYLSYRDRRNAREITALALSMSKSALTILNDIQSEHTGKVLLGVQTIMEEVVVLKKEHIEMTKQIRRGIHETRNHVQTLVNTRQAQHMENKIRFNRVEAMLQQVRKMMNAPDLPLEDITEGVTESEIKPPTGNEVSPYGPYPPHNPGPAASGGGPGVAAQP